MEYAINKSITDAQQDPDVAERAFVLNWKTAARQHFTSGIAVGSYNNDWITAYYNQSAGWQKSAALAIRLADDKIAKGLTGHDCRHNTVWQRYLFSTTKAGYRKCSQRPIDSNQRHRCYDVAERWRTLQSYGTERTSGRNGCRCLQCKRQQTRSDDQFINVHLQSYRQSYSRKKYFMGSYRDTTNFFWASNDAKMGRTDFIAYTFPYKDKNTFTAEYLIAKRDSVLKKNIPGAFPNSYMKTNAIETTYNAITLKNGKYCGVLRGLWEM